MSQYVALVSGINVGGRVMVPMARLRTLFGALGFADVRTVLQSGNVLFEAPSRGTELLRRRIEVGVQELTGTDVCVVLRTLSELNALMRDDPFTDISVAAGATKYVTFLARKSAVKLALPITSKHGDVEIVRLNRLVVLSIGRPAPGRPGFPNRFIEATLGVPATTREWNSLVRIVAERTAVDAGSRE